MADIVMQMREVEQYWLGQAQESFEEKEFEIMQFVKIGKRIVNLANVTEVHYSGMRHQWVISFVGASDNYCTVDEETEPEAFRTVQAWVNRTPDLDLSMQSTYGLECPF